MNHTFEKAPVDNEIVDVWPPRTWIKPVMLAYKQLHDRQRIRIHYPIEISEHTGRAVVRYDADVPEEWIHKELREIRDALLRDGEQQRMEL